MGDAQSVPILGEAVTVIESGVKITAAGVSGAVGLVVQPVVAVINTVADEKVENPYFNGAAKLAEGAGNSWKEYSEKNLIAGAINSEIKRSNGDYEGARRIEKKVLGSLEGFVDSVPVVGHAKGVYHYIDGDTEHGNRCMLGATRGAAVLAAGAVTGGVGGGAVAAGLAGVGTGVAYDTTATVIDSVVHDEERFHGTLSSVNQLVETGDPNGLVDLSLTVGGDFVSAAGAQQMIKARQLKNQQQALRKAYKTAQEGLPENMRVDPNAAMQDTIQTGRNLKKLVDDNIVKGDGHVLTEVKDIDTNQTYRGVNQRARANVNENNFAKQRQASGFKSKTNARNAAKKGPTTFQDLHPEVEPAPDLTRQQHACAEHEALSKLHELGRGVVARVRVYSVKFLNGCYKAVIRCENCMRYGELMGNVLTDLVEGTVVPVERVSPYVVKGCGCGVIVARASRKK